MKGAIADYETNRSMRDCRLRATEKWSEGRREESECFPDPSFLPPPAVIRSAQILVIGHDLNLEAQQLQQAFPPPLHRVQVADAASELLRDVLGDQTVSSRLVFGVASLPLGWPVELEVEP